MRQRSGGKGRKRKKKKGVRNHGFANEPVIALFPLFSQNRAGRGRRRPLGGKARDCESVYRAHSWAFFLIDLFLAPKHGDRGKKRKRKESAKRQHSKGDGSGDWAPLTLPSHRSCMPAGKGEGGGKGFSTPTRVGPGAKSHFVGRFLRYFSSFSIRMVFCAVGKGEKKESCV